MRIELETAVCPSLNPAWFRCRPIALYDSPIKSASNFALSAANSSAALRFLVANSFH